MEESYRKVRMTRDCMDQGLRGNFIIKCKFLEEEQGGTFTCTRIRLRGQKFTLDRKVNKRRKFAPLKGCLFFEKKGGALCGKPSK